MTLPAGKRNNHSCNRAIVPPGSLRSTRHPWGLAKPAIRIHWRISGSPAADSAVVGVNAGVSVAVNVVVRGLEAVIRLGLPQSLVWSRRPVARYSVHGDAWLHTGNREGWESVGDSREPHGPEPGKSALGAAPSWVRIKIDVHKRHSPSTLNPEGELPASGCQKPAARNREKKTPGRVFPRGPASSRRTGRPRWPILPTTTAAP